MGKLIEFNTSCASVFTQRAGLVALQRTDEVTPRVVAHLKTCRDTLVPLLQALPQVQCRGRPRAACTPSSSSTVSTTRWPWPSAWWPRPALGLAPGNAFAPEAQGWLRWCFASKDVARLGQGVERLQRLAVIPDLIRDPCLGEPHHGLRVKPAMTSTASGYNPKALHPARRTLRRSSSPQRKLKHSRKTQ